MDRGGDELVGWLIDSLAAGLLGAAIGACLLMLGSPHHAIGAGPAGVLLALASLRQVRPEPRRFKVPAFKVERFVDEPEVLELTEVAVDEPLLLEDRLPVPEEDSRVVRLFAARPLPTPGELARRIDHHLGQSEGSRDGRILGLEVDAAAALRQALGELRRGLA